MDGIDWLVGVLILLLSSFEVLTQRLSPEDYGLKSLPVLDDLPIPGLLESSDKSHDPRSHELNITMLRVKLGKNFDQNFMSIFRPKDLYNDFSNDILPHHNKSQFAFRRNKHGRIIPLGEMPDYIRDIDFRFIYLPDSTKVKTKISSKLKKKIQQFLWSMTVCPVVYRWRDLGSRFWPRWLKEGLCSGSCSVPPGMRCRPSITARKTLLRFHCRSMERSQRHCYWMKIEYPVISKCSCACPSASYS